MVTLRSLSKELGVNVTTVRYRCVKWKLPVQKAPVLSNAGTLQHTLVVSDQDAEHILNYYARCRAGIAPLARA